MQHARKLFASLAILVSFSARAAELSEVEQKLASAWAQVQLTLANAEEYDFDQHDVLFMGNVVKNGACYNSEGPGDNPPEEKFLACVMGLKELGRLLIPQVSFVPSRDLSRPEFLGSHVLETAGAFALVQLAPGKTLSLQALNPASRAAKILQDRSEILDLARDMVNESKAQKKDPIDFHAIAETMQKLKPAPMPDAKLAVALINGHDVALDAHSHLDLQALRALKKSDGNESLSGVGVRAMPGVRGLVVDHVVKKSPAYGVLRTGDLILEVDGHPLKDLSLEEGVKLMRGSVGSKVAFDVLRRGELKHLELTRAKYEVKNVEDFVASDMGMKFGVIRLAQFLSLDACEQIKDAVKRMEPNVDGYVLDLRNNPGGDTRLGVCVGQVFAGPKPMIYQKDLTSGSMDELTTTEKDKVTAALTAKPLVVLINGASVSAAEAVAGALQGLKRAWVLGARSFGKATVQNGFPFFMDQSNLVMFRTVAKFYTPYLSGAETQYRSNQRIGVIPDFEVPNLPGLSAQDRMVMREGEIFPNAVAADAKANWDELRPSERDGIQKCLDQGMKADKIFPTLPDGDYQLLKAEEVLSCENWPL